MMRVLNGGVLPEGFYALTEQHGSVIHVDILTLREVPTASEDRAAGPVGTNISGGTAVAEAPPIADITATGSEAASYALRRRTLTIRHASDDQIIALVEVVSPGNKDRAGSVEQFVRKCWSSLASGYHLLVVNLFPPSRHNPNGIHGEIWAGFSEEPYVTPSNKPLVAASYDATAPVTTYVRQLAVGQELPSMPLFLESGLYVDLPLNETYQEAYTEMPQRWRRVIEGRSET